MKKQEEKTIDYTTILNQVLFFLKEFGAEEYAFDYKVNGEKIEIWTDDLIISFEKFIENYKNGNYGKPLIKSNES